jgi:hypothetical protein
MTGGTGRREAEGDESTGDEPYVDSYADGSIQARLRGG